MTICIASLCEDSNKIIVASDRMITVGEIIEFEHEVTKFEPLTNNSIVLTAGSATVQNDILKDVKSKIKKYNDVPFEDLNAIIKSSYLEVRNRCSEELFLKPLGMDLDTFYKNQRSFLPEFTFRLIEKIENNNLDVSLVLCGFDEDKGNIQLIDDPGNSESFNSVGFCAVGSGSLNAVSIFTLHHYAPSFNLEKALYLTYAAKKNAERAPGVGCDTDIVIISKSGIEKLGAEEIKTLESIYDRHTKMDEEGYKEVRENIIPKLKNEKKQFSN